MSSATYNFETLLVSIKEKVALIVLNRVNKFNAFNNTQYNEFGDALKQCDNDTNVNVIVVTGNGKYFSSGNDLTQFAKAFTSKTPVRQFAMNGARTLTAFTSAIINTRKPIICGVNGPAIGIAVTILGLFDIVYASNTATFHTPFSSLGQSPEGLSSLTFIQKMGLSKANEVLLLGKKLNAMEAEKCNLVSEVWNVDGFRDKLMATAYKMAKYPTNGLMEVKALIRSQYKDIWAETMKREVDLLTQRWQSKECHDAVMHFFMRKRQKTSKL